MRYFTPYFWICLFIFIVNQGIEKCGVFIPFVHCYLDDVLAPGIVMGFALAVQQQFTFRQSSYCFTKGHVIFFVIWYSLLFEVIFPHFDSRHHADVLDVLAYSIGGLFFWLWGNLSVPGLYPKWPLWA